VYQNNKKHTKQKIKMKTVREDHRQTDQVIHYKIGGYLLRIILPSALDLKNYLPSFTDFSEENLAQSAPDIQINVQQDNFPDCPSDGKMLTDKEGEFGQRFVINELQETYLTTIFNTTRAVEWQMISSKDFSQSTIYMTQEVESLSIFSWLIKLAFGQAVIFKKGMLVHASVIALGNLGIVFLDENGNGIHGQQWLRQIPGSRLLNDDNPLIQIGQQGDVSIHATPWGGNSSCYIPDQKQLKVLVRLKKGLVNQLTWVAGKEAFIALIPSVVVLRWNRVAYNLMLDSLEYILGQVDLGIYSCLPNAEAATYCYQEIIKNKKQMK